MVYDETKLVNVAALKTQAEKSNGDYEKLAALIDALSAMENGYYKGVDLTQKFAAEIAAAPYYGDPWAWIQARVQAGDYTGIHVGDYIPVTTTNGVTLNAEIAGINTYKGYGDTEIGNHIDFICRELWPIRKPINPANYNNGLIPVETITGDGESTVFALTKEMNDVASVMQNDEGLTGYTYDANTFTLTFDEAPAAGAITITGTGTEYPWLASDMYHWLNSLAGQIPNSTGLNPAVKHVDYTQDGVYYYLPDALKNVIVEKRMCLPKRYSASGLLSNDNTSGWVNIGKLWLPSEFEVYGAPCWGGKTGYSTMGNSVQYPIFAHNMHRMKYRDGIRCGWWLLIADAGNAGNWCYINSDGRSSGSNTALTIVGAPVCFRIA